MFLHTDLALALCIISIRSLRGLVLSCAGNHGERGPELAAESVLKQLIYKWFLCRPVLTFSVNVKNSGYARLPTSVKEAVTTSKKTTLRFANFTNTLGSIAAFSLCCAYSSGESVSAFAEI